MGEFRPGQAPQFQASRDNKGLAMYQQVMNMRVNQNTPLLTEEFSHSLYGRSGPMGSVMWDPQKGEIDTSSLSASIFTESNKENLRAKYKTFVNKGSSVTGKGWYNPQSFEQMFLQGQAKEASVVLGNLQRAKATGHLTDTSYNKMLRNPEFQSYFYELGQSPVGMEMQQRFLATGYDPAYQSGLEWWGRVPGAVKDWAEQHPALATGAAIAGVAAIGYGGAALAGRAGLGMLGRMFGRGGGGAAAASMSRAGRKLAQPWMKTKALAGQAPWIALGMGKGGKRPPLMLGPKPPQINLPQTMPPAGGVGLGAAGRGGVAMGAARSPLSRAASRAGGGTQTQMPLPFGKPAAPRNLPVPARGAAAVGRPLPSPIAGARVLEAEFDVVKPAVTKLLGPASVGGGKWTLGRFIDKYSTPGFRSRVFKAISKIHPKLAEKLSKGLRNITAGTIAFNFAAYEAFVILNQIGEEMD